MEKYIARDFDCPVNIPWAKQFLFAIKRELVHCF